MATSEKAKSISASLETMEIAGCKFADEIAGIVCA